MNFDHDKVSYHVWSVPFGSKLVSLFPHGCVFSPLRKLSTLLSEWRKKKGLFGKQETCFASYKITRFHSNIDLQPKCTLDGCLLMQTSDAWGMQGHGPACPDPDLGVLPALSERLLRAHRKVLLQSRMGRGLVQSRLVFLPLGGDGACKNLTLVTSSRMTSCSKL